MSDTPVTGWHDLNEVVKLWEKIKGELWEIINKEGLRRAMSKGDDIDSDDVLAWATDIVSEYEGPFVWAETLTDVVMKEMEE